MMVEEVHTYTEGYELVTCGTTTENIIESMIVYISFFSFSFGKFDGVTLPCTKITEYGYKS